MERIAGTKTNETKIISDDSWQVVVVIVSKLHKAKQHHGKLHRSNQWAIMSSNHLKLNKGIF
jgi:hypothetical protein